MLPVGPKPKFVDPAKLFGPYLKMDLRVWSFHAPVKISTKHAISASGTKFHERKKNRLSLKWQKVGVGCFIT
jgi:hypothetical protein